MQCCCEENKKTDSVDLSLIEGIVEKYKDTKGSLITILQGVQEIYNYVPMEAIEYIAEQTGIKPAKIYGVLTFYTQFRMNPVGKNLIMLCQGTACHVNGSEGIEEAIHEELGINDGETSEDGLFTLINVACLGCCSLSPVMMINGETYGKLTPQSTKKIIAEMRARDKEEA
ncbi:MAG: NADH-quinone oxidoreductase subunit NuoE [Proteocatella sp.]|nr:NADH-quinone oxidoreductase subunit NuoE [Proteocatella sp.]MBP7912950.1 NADH-quinone oxidoreductase subunit NuoE [Proteocatella sp.]MBP9659116.1 NADH-quinone oxidoreductase subunit NuoE [Proteocatella sp.]